jgi:uroporphyrinogen decarboxylase
MNKRETMLSLLSAEGVPDYTPAAFFLHFDPTFHAGRAAVDKHLEYFRYTGMDLVKIQYEKNYPPVETIRRPVDWRDMPSYDDEFYREPWDVVAGLVESAGHDAVVVVTLYSPFMLACQAAGRDTVLAHLREAPDEVRRGLETITESWLRFVRGCVDRGVDGFYASTQGGERNGLGTDELFDRVVKPADLAIMREIDATCRFNILHVCDYHGPYDDIARYTEYPGHVVSYPSEVGGRPVPPTDAARLFRRPVMGGLDRHGVLATGTPEAVRSAAREVLADAPERFVLGADCTVPSDTSWDNLRAAIDTAHTRTFA